VLDIATFRLNKLGYLYAQNICQLSQSAPVGPGVSPFNTTDGVSFNAGSVCEFLLAQRSQLAKLLEPFNINLHAGSLRLRLL